MLDGGVDVWVRKECLPSSYAHSHNTQGLRAIQQPYEPSSSSFFMPLADFDSHEALHAFFLRLRTSSPLPPVPPRPRTLQDRSNQMVENGVEDECCDELAKKEAAIRGFIDKAGIGRIRRRRYVPGRGKGEGGRVGRKEGRDEWRGERKCLVWALCASFLGEKKGGK